MARPYGKFLSRRSKIPRGGAVIAAKFLPVKIKARYDLEQLRHLVQRLLARLENQGVESVEDCALYFAPWTPRDDG